MATCFADIEVTGHRETWPILSKGLRGWLTHRFYNETGGAPNNDAMQSARRTLEAKARFDGPEHMVHLRVGELDGKHYLDLCNDEWQVVEFDANGWRLAVNPPPIRFRRSSGMKSLPKPVRGGSIDLLRSLLNVKSANDFHLIVSWLLAAFRSYGPYPVLVVTGEQGTAKSTFTSIVRSLLDPNVAPLRTLPRNIDDLFIAAMHGHVLAFDNISRIPAPISDALCRLATGGGLGVRKFFTNDDEVLFNATRPIILNGIVDFVTRADLADRAIPITLEPIPTRDRRPEQEIWHELDRERPVILGVLLDAMVVGLTHLPTVSLPSVSLPYLPRMADFAKWGAACETAFGAPGSFWTAYSANRDDVIETVIDADPVATAIRKMMESQKVWTGTATELFAKLGAIVGEPKSLSWPKAANILSGDLKTAAPGLRAVGIDIERGRTKPFRIQITLNPDRPAEDAPPTSSASSAAYSAFEIKPKAEVIPGVAANHQLTMADDADGDDAPDVRTKPPEINGQDATDDADDAHSAQETTPQPWRQRWVS